MKMFFHIPRTGGTFIRNIFNIKFDDKYQKHKGYQVCFDYDNVNFITILRDPVQRALSNYHFYNHHNRIKNSSFKSILQETTKETIPDTYKGFNWFFNYYTAAYYNKGHAFPYVKQDNINSINEDRKNIIIENIDKNIVQYINTDGKKITCPMVYCITENTQDAINKFETFLNKSPTKYEIEPMSNYRSYIDDYDEVVELLKDKNKLDIEIYNFLKNKINHS